MFGSNSENQEPVCPYCFHLNLDAVSVPPRGPDLPLFFCSSGLYSKVSKLDTAPSMNKKMMRFAFGVKCGGFGARGFCVPRSDDAAFAAASPKSPARASCPKP